MTERFPSAPRSPATILLPASPRPAAAQILLHDDEDEEKEEERRRGSYPRLIRSDKQAMRINSLLAAAVVNINHVTSLLWNYGHHDKVSSIIRDGGTILMGKGIDRVEGRF